MARPALTKEYVEMQQELALFALDKQKNHQWTLRRIAEELGYNHPQTVANLIKRYGPEA